jgi:hypothetical protein
MTVSLVHPQPALPLVASLPSASLPLAAVRR